MEAHLLIFIIPLALPSDISSTVLDNISPHMLTYTKIKKQVLEGQQKHYINDKRDNKKYYILQLQKVRLTVVATDLIIIFWQSIMVSM